MKVLFSITLILISGFDSIWAQCDKLIESNYDEFDKIVRSELEYISTYSTFKSDDGTEYIGDHIGFRWNDWFYTKTSQSTRGWSNGKAIEISYWSKIQICEGSEQSCWQFSDTFSSSSRGYNDWNRYMNNEIDDPIGYGYIHFIATNDEDLRIYLKYDEHQILLNDPNYPRSIEHYQWLGTHKLKKVRFHNAKNFNNLDVKIRTDDSDTFQWMLFCIDSHKSEVSANY